MKTFHTEKQENSTSSQTRRKKSKLEEEWAHVRHVKSPREHNKQKLAKKFNYQNFSLFWYFAWERIRLANIQFSEQEEWEHELLINCVARSHSVANYTTWYS